MSRMQKMVPHTTFPSAMRRCRAIAGAKGYPKPASKRGRLCPPHPFGETTLETEPVEDEREGGWYTPDEPTLEGRKVRVGSSDYTISSATAVDVDMDKMTPLEPKGRE